MKNQELKNVAKMSETAANILNFVSKRRRNTVYTAFSGLRADMKKAYGKAVDRKDFDDTFRMLSTIGAGKLECSKRGVCLGFYWTIPLRQLAAVIKNNETPAAVAPLIVVENLKAVENQNKVVKTAPDSKRVTVVILRRGGQPRTIQIPENRLREFDLQ